MIIGMGNDLLDIGRFEKVMKRHEARFAARCFTEIEIARCEARRGTGRHIESYAKRFAAKEACAKALGSGINHGVYMKDIGVDNDDNGQPFLVLTDGAKARLDDLTPPGKIARLHLSISDEPPMAQAFVLIEAL